MLQINRVMADITGCFFTVLTPENCFDFIQKRWQCLKRIHGNEEFRNEDSEVRMTLRQIDEALVRAAQQGNRKDLENLLFKAQPDIRRYAMKHCMIGDVDDAVQEVLLTMARKLESLRVIAALSSWLFTSTRRECRKLGRVALRSDPWDENRADEWLESASGPELLYEVLDALDHLPDDYRQVLLLKDYQQLSNQEIAERLNISLAATKSRLHRAREMVRDYLIVPETDSSKGLA